MLDLKTSIKDVSDKYNELYEKDTKEYVPRKTQYSYFAMVLYPEEDEGHRFVLDELNTAKTLFPKVMYISHDKDVYTDEDDFETDEDDGHVIGELKKKHTHVLFKVVKKGTPTGLKEHFKGLVKYIKGIDNQYAYAMYLLHQTAKCKIKNKHIYSYDEVQGDKEFIEELFIQNTNSVQFVQMLELINKFKTMSAVYMYLYDTDKNLFEFAKKNNFIFVTLQNQIINYNKKVKGE